MLHVANQEMPLNRCTNHCHGYQDHQLENVVVGLPRKARITNGRNFAHTNKITSSLMFQSAHLYDEYGATKMAKRQL